MERDGRSFGKSTVRTQNPEQGSLPEFHIIQRQETSFRYETGLTILYGMGGSAYVTVGESVYELGREGILAINPCILFRMECLNASALLLSVPAWYLKAAGHNSGNFACYTRDAEGFQPTYDTLREMLAEVLYEYLQNKNKVSTAERSVLFRLLQTLAEEAGDIIESRKVRMGDGEKAAAFIRYINSHWHEDLTLTSLAEEAHFSLSYLSKFFQHKLGMNFSSYLRKVRMIHARRMLMSTDLSVTQVAYDCGFHNTSVFIEAFKQECQMTPGQFRQQVDDGKGTGRNAPGQNHDQRSDFSVLLSHMPEKNTEQILVREENIEIECSKNISVRRPMVNEKISVAAQTAESLSDCPAWVRMLNIGYARDGLMAPVQDQMRRAQKEIGFTYFRCHGIFDDDMRIYRECEDGSPVFSFCYVDALFDFVIELGFRPFIELSFMPSQIALRQTRIFDRPSVIAGCADLEKWKHLVRAFIEHLQQRYGIETIRSWRFSTISLSYVRIGCLKQEEYAQLYEATYRTVREIDPKLSFGGAGCFPDLIDNEEIGVPWFLRFAAEHDCLPDFHSIQWYPCIQTDDRLFMEYTMNQNAAPALLSRDPDYLKERLDTLDDLFQKYQVGGRELFLEECNSTLWQRDLSGDTCYKAVWLAKNTIISARRAVFGYWLLTDLIEERGYIKSVFHGGYGLFTCNGIPKAGYQGLRLLGRLGQTVLDQGDCWIMTAGRCESEPAVQPAYDKGGFPPSRMQMTPEDSFGSLQLLVYNYCHYTDLNCYRYKQLERPEEAYSVFQTGEKRRLQFQLKGFEPGKYRIVRYTLNRKQGSSFDLWLRLGSPSNPRPEEIRYLKENAEPACSMEMAQCGDTLNLETEILPLEMELWVIERA